MPLPVAVIPPGLDVTVYPVIGLPLFDGAIKLTVALPLPCIADTFVGAPGTVLGVTEFDGADAGPVPPVFVAVTVNVYGVPFVKPGTVIGLPMPLTCIPPGLDVTV